MVRVGLHDAEQDYMKHKTFPNYALMKISAYHKARGDFVDWWTPILTSECNVIYSSKTATVQTTSANSAPSFSNFTYKDGNLTTTAITANDQLFIKGYSQLSITAAAATAQNGASITQYEATIDGTTVKSSSTALSIGTLKTAGNLSLTVKAIDSRGYERSVTKTVTVIAYDKISVSNCTMRRVNEVEEITQVSFEANISKILVSGSNKNVLQILRYRYKKTSDAAYGGYTTITSLATVTDTKVSFSSDEFISLNADYSYDIQFWVYDKLSNNNFVVTLPSGTPLISKRRKKLGINNRRPQSALDVVGEIRQNGFNVMGVVEASIIEGTDLNNIIQPGLYFQRDTPGSGLNFPTLSFGMLEVFSPSTNFIIQRYTRRDTPFNMYIRSRVNGSWSAWVEK